MNRNRRDRNPKAEGGETVPSEKDQDLLRFVRLVASAMDAGNPFTHGRAYRCSKQARLLGMKCGLDAPALLDLEYAGLLLDLGKRIVLHGMVQKAGPLEDHERDRMATHTSINAQLLAEIPFLAGAARVIGASNERFDGTGRPDALAGEAIPLASRVLTIVSALDAMTSDRPYREGLTAAEAFAELRREAGSRFDPKLVETIIQLHQSGELSAEFDPRDAVLYRYAEGEDASSRDAA